MLMPTLRRLAPWCALVFVLASMPVAPASAVTRSCGSDLIANTQSVLCASGTCSASAVRVTTAIEIPVGGCELDLGGRSLSIERTIQVTGLGWFVVGNAGDVTLTATGRVKARGDYVKPNGFVIGGGLISFVSAGAIDIAGGFDVSGDGAGTLRLDAQRDVTLRSGSSVTGNGISASADEGEKYADGGTVEIAARTGSVVIAGDVSLSGANQATGGTLDVTAGRDVTLSRSIDLSGGGSDGGELDVTAGDAIAISAGIDVRSRAGGGYGGVIALAAGEDAIGGVVPGGTVDVNGASLILQGSAGDTFGGDGGELDVTAYGRVRFFGAGVTIRADAGTNFDGSGGTLTIDAGDVDPNVIGPTDGDVLLGGVITMRSGTTGGDGGLVSLSAGRDLVFTASLDASGNDTGGDVNADAGRTVTIGGSIAVQALSAGAEGGFVDVVAGVASDEGGLGMLNVLKDVLASSGSGNGGGQSLSLAACGLSVAPNVKIDGSGGVNPSNQMAGGSDVTLIARRPMQLGAGSRYLAGPGGTVTTVHPAGQLPIVGAGVVFTPARRDEVLAIGPYPNCAVCGDGIRQIGEVCDRGAAADGACCNATCTASLCVTPTPTPTLVTTRTATPTPGPSATLTMATTTATPSATLTATGGGATVTPLASGTGTTTTTPTNSATPVRTATPAPTAVPTPVAGVDHYQCYTASHAPGSRAPARRSTTLADDFESKRTTVVRTSEVCLPVDENGRGIADRAAHLQCFTIRDAAGEARFQPRVVTVDDDLGTTRSLLLRKSERLCLPATRDGVPSALRLADFKCYTAKALASAPRFATSFVALADDFGSALVTVRRPASVCVTVDRDGADRRDSSPAITSAAIPSAAIHCYELKRAAGQPLFVPRTVTVTSALGTEQVVLRKPSRLCLATAPVLPPPRCDDGRVDAGEACDDGNTISGDGCSATCRLESCGNGVVDGAEHCDDGGANGQNQCCSSDCRRVDPDGDGICSRDDRCPDDVDNDSDGDGYCVGPSFTPPAVGGGDPCSRSLLAGEVRPTSLVVAHLDRTIGAQTLSFKGTVAIPPGGASIDPIGRGVRLRMADALGGIVLDEIIVPGVFPGVSGLGWKATGKAPVGFTYRDKLGRRGGITKVVIRDRSVKRPGAFEVAVTGAGSYRLPEGAAFALTVALNAVGDAPGSPPGVDQCGEARFVPGDAQCRTGRGTLRCRTR